MKFISYFINLLFPKHCIFCNHLTGSNEDVCDNCKDCLPFSENVCSVCGKYDCICRKSEFKFTKMVAVYDYKGGVVNAISQLKFHGRLGYADPLGRMMWQRLVRTDFVDRIDLIIPIAMTKKDLRKREYNQSALLARALSKQSGIPTDEKLLVKVRQTEKQHFLSESERRKNLAGAFSLTNPDAVAGKTILLCDDVCTTGATFAEVAALLLKCGAEEVFCLAVASTQTKKNGASI